MFSLYCPFTIVRPLRHSSIVLLFRIGSHPAVYKPAIVLQSSLKLNLVCNTNVLEVFTSLACPFPSIPPLSSVEFYSVRTLLHLILAFQYTFVYVIPLKVLGTLTILPDNFFTNYCKLVLGIRLLNQHRISEVNVCDAH